ncbi:MAG TPA: hypothetical protein VKA21_12575 [Candidatus Binatia bacterium]|nr:hypothetical protein [Candidatus Binatia bacterium]
MSVVLLLSVPLPGAAQYECTAPAPCGAAEQNPDLLGQDIRAWLRRDATIVFGSEGGAVRAVNRPFVVYGTTQCPAGRTLVYTGSIRRSAPTSNDTDWNCWQPAGTSDRIGDCVLCY